MPNTINADTIKLIKEYEGRVLTAYPDPATKNDPVKKGEPWTIGYGHTGRLAGPDVNKGDVITVEIADLYLKADLDKAGERVSKLVTVPLNDNQFGALVSFYFNVGEGTFKKSSVLKNVNEKNFGTVPGRLALYRLADGKVFEGLVRRRNAEGALWLKVDTKTEVKGAIKETVGVKVEPDQNGKKPWDLGAVGASAALLASLSGEVKTTVGNVTEAFHINPSWLLVAIGLGFTAWTLLKRFKKDV